ncbi:Inactive selenide water dikinase-like protein [Taenia crassiceps]|uniref:Inactive selenide water dikinase-like protein n=1 Tax=Taenia crassiceps TaxID=6207 RepID=A0ABR4QJT0_9CEST
MSSFCHFFRRGALFLTQFSFCSQSKMASRSLTGCKLPQAELIPLLAKLSGCSNSSTPSTSPTSLLSTELDCCVIPVRNNLKLIQTTDFFYANVDDPYTMGWITCCNVLSDLYAMGVADCDNLLLLLGIPTTMTVEERTTITALIMQGFQECALKAGTSVRGGQTTYNPWVLIGGVATSVVPDSEFIMPNKAEEGSVLVLTKPLGTQLAVTAYNWMLDRTDVWTEKCAPRISEEEMRSLYNAATMSMCRLNRNAARLMGKHGAQACTDVTGFGLLGHARNLAAVQTAAVTFEINRLPCLAGAHYLSKALASRHHLDTALTPETSGGLLVAIPEKSAEAYCQDIFEEDGTPSWIVGAVRAAATPAEARTARLSADVEIVEVPHETLVLK